MSAAAVMLVKDEADIIETTIDHLSRHFDEIIVADNASTDGTFELLMSDDRVALVLQDDVLGYWQSRKTTHLARLALDRGHQWVVPVDADELWLANGQRVADYLDAQGPDVHVVRAQLFNHLPTTEDDPSIANPVERIRWRQKRAAPLPKVAARAADDLTIEAGNHGASYNGTWLAISSLLTIRHFSWRSEEQYLRKIRNGERAYAATDLPEDTGAHWRAFEGKPDEAVVEHFRRWFVRPEPRKDGTLVEDPAPVGAGSLV